MQIAERAAEHGRVMRLATLGVMVCGAFLSSSNGVGLSPFLLDIAHDLGTNLAAVSLLVAVINVTWGITSLLAGTASDRLGRKPVLVAALLILTAYLFGISVTRTYIGVLAWRLLCGVGGGAFMGTVFAAAADHFPAAERGKALGWIMVGQSLAIVLGVPLITIAGALVGWRGALAAQGAVTALAALAVWLIVPRVAGRHAEAAMPARALLRLVGPRMVALLTASTMERLCYAGVGVFLPTYLILTYGISLGSLALGLALVACGNLAGNMLGGYLADRISARLALFAAALAATALLAVPLFFWQPGLFISLALGLVYTLCNAIGRPSLLSTLSEVSPGARGSVLGLNVTFSSFGWLGATALGGWLIATSGFQSLGLVILVGGLFGAALAAGVAILGGTSHAAAAVEAAG